MDEILKTNILKTEVNLGWSVPEEAQDGRNCLATWDFMLIRGIFCVTHPLRPPVSHIP